MIRLGVNLDHVATVRQARKETYPDPVQIACLAEIGGADNITAHLREDRRHMLDRDIRLLKETIQIPLNFEMACTQEMVAIACELRPHSISLVPEKREELTTEGGLNLFHETSMLDTAVKKLKSAGCAVVFFIEPDLKQVEQAKALGGDAIEFHTGGICHRFLKTKKSIDYKEVLTPLIQSSQLAHTLGLQVHIGHGINYTNAHWFQLVPFVEEANIGHAIVARSMFVGMESAVREMKRLINSPFNKPDFPCK